MSSTKSKSTDGRKTGSVSSRFNAESLSESDIENIWKNLVKNSTGKKTNSIDKSKVSATSIDTTPTTDYSENLIPLHPETEEEALEQDKQLVRMNKVLRTKKLQPKSHLPQVILCDNVSHDRLLAMRLEEIKHAHEVAEKRAKRREETFVKSLERKQKEWIKRDARTLAKLEPENLSEFNFAFGRLYNRPDYPYQAVIQTLNSIHPPARTLDHARRRPTLLPQVTNKAIFDDEEEDKTFITKLPRLKDTYTTLPPSDVANASRALEAVSSHFPKRLETIKETRKGRKRREPRKKEKLRKRAKDWTEDMRFHTLTNLLGERYSPHSTMKDVAADKPVALSGII